MNKLYKNLCGRCGRERIKVKVWQENMGFGSLVTVTENECPNADCQMHVERDNKRVRDRVIAMKLDREKRMQLMHQKKRTN